jgi:hypothetical protein
MKPNLPSELMQPPAVQIPAAMQQGREYADLLAEIARLRLELQARPTQSNNSGAELKPPKPEIYSGGRDVGNWLFGVEQYFEAAGVSDDTKS